MAFERREASHEIEEDVSDAKDDGNEEHGAVSAPAHGLLVPKSCQHAEEGDEDTNRTQNGLPVASHAAAAHHAVANAVEGVDVNAYQHPHDESNPGVGRKEEHHAHAADHTGCRDVGHKRRFEAARRVGLCASHDNDAEANQCESEESADACHFACDSGRHGGTHDADDDHEEQVAASGRMVSLVKM